MQHDLRSRRRRGGERHLEPVRDAVADRAPKLRVVLPRRGLHRAQIVGGQDPPVEEVRILDAAGQHRLQ